MLIGGEEENKRESLVSIGIAISHSWAGDEMLGIFFDGFNTNLTMRICQGWSKGEIWEMDGRKEREC